MATKEKNIWILIIFILSGLVVGGLLGEFGLSSPLELDLSIMKITFGLTFRMNIASIIGMILSIFIYRKV